MAALDLLLSLSIPALIIAHLLIAPYTKVEESFNLQATHDILVYGTPTSHIAERLALYDHFEFPGAVPRTFIGPILLAGLSQPLIAVVGFQHAQLVVRAVLGLANAAALLVFKANVERGFGRNVARWYALLQATQFHVVFYASRTLPNMFAFGFTTLAFAQLLPLPRPDSRKQTRRFRLAIALLTFATAVFRSELAILLVAVTLHRLLSSSSSTRGAISFLSRTVLTPFLSASAFALLVSVPLDSYFWQKWPPVFWPELWGFYYNAVLGSSSAWGVSPWHWYFTSALPRILANPLAFAILLPLALCAADRRRAGARRLAAPALLFVAIYSLQPHKEARFVFYAAPPLTAAAAIGADSVWTNRRGSVVRRLAALAVAASVPLSFAVAAAMLAFSSLNYPGGEALGALLRGGNKGGNNGGLVAPDLQGGTVVVHTGVLACMTGVTLFGQHPSMDNLHLPLPLPLPSSSSRKIVQQQQTGAEKQGGKEEEEDGEKGGKTTTTFTFDKTEDPAALRNPAFWERFDYVLADEEDPVAAAVPGGGAASASASWEVVGVVEGFAGIEIEKPPVPLPPPPPPPPPPPGSGVMGERERGVESGGADGRRDYRVVGRGELVRRIKERVRGLTGGWWVGPRMVPKVYVLRRMREGEGRRAVAE